MPGRNPRIPLVCRIREARHRSRSFATASRLPASFRLAMRSRAAGLDPPSVPTALRRRVMVGRTSSVDFCNRNVSRARPRFVRALLHRALGRPCAQLLPDLARRFRDARAPGLQVAPRLVRLRAFTRRREDPCAGLPGDTSSHRLRDDLRPRTTRSRAPFVEADPGHQPAEKSRVRGRT